MITIVIAVTCAAPVPTHLMKERAPVGTWVNHGYGYLRVAEIKTKKNGDKFYRLTDVVESNKNWKMNWVAEHNLIAVMEHPDKFFLIFSDPEFNK